MARKGRGRNRKRGANGKSHTNYNEKTAQIAILQNSLKTATLDTIINNQSKSIDDDYTKLSDDYRVAANLFLSKLTGELNGGDAVNDDMDYNFNIPNWGYDDFINERAMFQKGTSSLAGEPGYFYFKIFFNFNTSFGLLGNLVHTNDSISDDIIEDKSQQPHTMTFDDTIKNQQQKQTYLYNNLPYYSTNSALKYLFYSGIGKVHDSDDIPGRMLALFKFGNLLSYISNMSPWFFKEVKNLATADSYQLTEISQDKNTLEIGLNQDAVDMRITTLFDLYRYACFDKIKMKEIIPENLRKFDMDIMVFQAPLKYYDTAISSKKLKKQFDYKKLSYSTNMDNMPTFKMYSFLGCEFDLDSLSSLMSDIKNEAPSPIGETSVKITYSQVHTHTMNDWYRIMFGTDGFYYNANHGSELEGTLINAITNKKDNSNKNFSLYDDISTDEQYKRMEAKKAVLNSLLYYNVHNGQYKELIDASEALCSDLYRTIVPRKALGNLYENIISGGVGPDSAYFKEKMKALHLGSLYNKEHKKTLSKLWSSIKEFTFDGWYQKIIKNN